jgi:hypothetical protein
MTKRRHPKEEGVRLTKEEQNDFMKAVAAGLDDVFNAGWNEGKPRRIGFALLTYEFGEPIAGTGRVNYIGNGRREDVLVAMKEVVARWEGRRPDVPYEGKSS